MHQVLYLQNGEFDGPGLLASVLAECGVGLTIVHAWRNEPMPADLTGFDGLAVGGGSMSAYQREAFPFLNAELALLAQAQAAGKPVLGICLGAQLLALALGAEVFPNRSKEIGLFELTFTPEAGADPLWQGLTAAPFHPVHWHGDTFSLPAGATRLASSALTPNQMFRVGSNLYGFQFHPEIDQVSLVEMIELDALELLKLGVEPAAFEREGARYLPAAEAVARTVFARWATLLNAKPVGI